MPGLTSICYNPSCRILGSNLFRQRCCHRPSSSGIFSASKPNFCSGLALKKAVSGTTILRMPNFIDKSITACAFADAHGDEVAEALEHEAYADESSGLPSKFGIQEFESSLNRASKWITTATLCGILLWRHDTLALWFATGARLNGTLSVVLKRILNQERPSDLRSDPGMPSSHAQTIFYTIMLAILSSLELLGTNELAIAFSGLIFAVGSYFTYLRVSQKLHTVSQVVVGAIVGSIFSISWYWIWNSFMMDAFASHLWAKMIVALGIVSFFVSLFLELSTKFLKDE